MSKKRQIWQHRQNTYRKDQKLDDLCQRIFLMRPQSNMWLLYRFYRALAIGWSITVT